MKISIACTSFIICHFYLINVAAFQRRIIVTKKGHIPTNRSIPRLQERRIPETSPEPKKFGISASNFLNIASSSVQILFRIGSGVFVNGYNLKIDDANSDEYSLFELFGKRPRETSKPMKVPKLPIEMYEFEGCPFCRKVREAVHILDLDVMFYPCPRGGPTFRSKVIKQGGKAQFPYMIDPNTKTSTYESDTIIKYLFDTYGAGSKVPFTLSSNALVTFSCGLGLIPRLGRGSKFEECKTAKQPLILWGYEASPFCKIVRERLCELELAHLYKSCTRGSRKRDEMIKKTGYFQVPLLEDPNTNIVMYESEQIIEYLDKTYSYKVIV